MQGLVEIFATYPVLGQAVAGAAGGVIRTLIRLEQGGAGMTWRSAGSNVLAGMILAIYAVPIITGFIEQKTDLEMVGVNRQGEFLAGAFGLAILGFFADLWRVARKEESKDE